ncbi:MAG: aminotransferase class IV [Chloroflexi bacterium]|nr:aminotransferase class IV [Chloroflexota bacterium]
MRDRHRHPSAPTNGDRSDSVYVNGEIIPREAARVSPLDRGFTLGDGVFETMRLSRGRIFRLAQHLARLSRSAASIRLVLPMSEQEFGAALYGVVTANGLSEAVLRLTVTRGISEGRGLLPTGQTKPTVVIQPSPFVPPSSQKYQQGFQARTASVRRNETSPTAFAKTLNYVDNIVARLEAASAGADEAIMLNIAGLVASGTASNLFLAKAGKLLTPSIESGVLAGITRAAILEIAAGMGIPTSEQVIDPTDLTSADECFVTNAVFGVMPVVKLDGSDIGTGKPGPLTAALRQAYNHLVEAETARDK